MPLRVALAQLAAVSDRGANLRRALQAMDRAATICCDRHYPEYPRTLGVAGAELEVIPQAGSVGEWPDGLFEAEVRTAPVFAGESFAVDCEGQVIARGKTLEEDLVIAERDLGRSAGSTAGRLFRQDRRPDLYPDGLC